MGLCQLYEIGDVSWPQINDDVFMPLRLVFIILSVVSHFQWFQYWRWLYSRRNEGDLHMSLYNMKTYTMIFYSCGQHRVFPFNFVLSMVKWAWQVPNQWFRHLVVQQTTVTSSQNHIKWTRGLTTASYRYHVCLSFYSKYWTFL